MPTKLYGILLKAIIPRRRTVWDFGDMPEPPTPEERTLLPGFRSKGFDRLGPSNFQRCQRHMLFVLQFLKFTARDIGSLALQQKYHVCTLQDLGTSGNT